MLEAVEELASGSRSVIMKRLRDPQDAEAIRSFFDECRVVEQLDHPGIVRLLDVGVENGRPFQVLELIDGIDTRRLIDGARELAAPVPRDVALHITAQAAHALDYAHHLPGLELVHRDVTPENILIARDGSVRLTDFGIAVFSERSTSTLVGMTRGKLAYMSPEQVLASHLDSRADIFSMGCVLHALLTGQSPLEEEANQERLLLREPLALSNALDEAARSIIAKAIAPDRRDRYQEARELAVACETQMESSEPRRLVAALVERLSFDNVATTSMDAPEQTFTLVLDRTQATTRSFAGHTASGATLSEFLTFLTSRDFGDEVHTETAPRAFDLEGTTESRTGAAISHTLPNPLRPAPLANPAANTHAQRSSVPRSKALVWASAATAVVALGLIATLALQIHEKTQARSQLEASLPVPTPSVPVTAVPGKSPPEAQATTTDPEPFEALPKRRPRRATRPSDAAAATKAPAETPVDEAAMTRSLRRLVAEIRGAQDALPPGTLRRLEGAYLELGTAANQATTDGERAAIVDRASRLMSELRRAAEDAPKATDSTD